MTERLEAKFEAIATDAISAAERVNCEGREFVDGLKMIIDSLVQRWECARDEFGED